ncbi:MAG: hypothetical protein CMO55_09460 [Verrucomicrobiales bacterium]|nr:hypothetical protein [Verrucomicrobiales bacterium]
MSRKRTANRKLKSRRKPPRHGLAAFVPVRASTRRRDIDGSGLKTIKFLIGILLLPLCWVLMETFLVLLRADTIGGDYWRSQEFLFFGVGCLLWLALFFGFRTRLMMWLYVAGHELTHALFALVYRGKVSKVHISAEGGHILTDRNNFVISLSPYFFPFYTAIAILAWAMAGWIIGRESMPDEPWLYGLIGFTWMFHLSFTIWMIRRDQPDLAQNGKLFSATVIFSMNVLLICVLLIVSSPTATFHGFGVSFWENARSLGSRFIESVLELIG